MKTIQADPRSSALVTDFYQLTMLDAYYREGTTQTAVFEFYVRRLPQSRNFLVAAGLEQVLEYLETLQFTAEETDWLASLGRFSDGFLQRLRTFRFTGDVYAMREGTVFFANEPVLRVEAPLPQAQIVESRLVNLLHYQTLIASKAARCRLACQDAQFIEFGMRRAHGSEAAVSASRASYIAGFAATATVEAARRFGIPVVGTMAHSFIQAHDSEVAAFESFATAHPDNFTLLIDTYDTERGAYRAAALANALRSQGIELGGVRIDSGDLEALSKRVRAILDDHDCRNARIYVSGDLDEYAIARLRANAAPIDAYCVGTRLSVSKDAPSLDCVYKLNQYAGRPSRKRSAGKASWPGPRQVFRQLDSRGKVSRDIIACADESMAGQALLHRVMANGARTFSAPALSEVRDHCTAQLASLPDELRVLEPADHSPVEISQRLSELAEQVDRQER